MTPIEIAGVGVALVVAIAAVVLFFPDFFKPILDPVAAPKDVELTGKFFNEYSYGSILERGVFFSAESTDSNGEWRGYLFRVDGDKTADISKLLGEPSENAELNAHVNGVVHQEYRDMPKQNEIDRVVGREKTKVTLLRVTSFQILENQAPAKVA